VLGIDWRDGLNHSVQIGIGRIGVRVGLVLEDARHFALRRLHGLVESLLGLALVHPFGHEHEPFHLVHVDGRILRRTLDHFQDGTGRGRHGGDRVREFVHGEFLPVIQVGTTA
jgi:hypothetical protein